MKVEGGETKLYLEKGEIKGTGSQVVQINALNLDGQTLGPLKLKNTKVASSQPAPTEQPDGSAAPQAVSIQGPMLTAVDPPEVKKASPQTMDDALMQSVNSKWSEI